MVPGFNHNVMHKGRMFHIQTEDSGPKKPWIVTHLFAHGGHIIDSRKTSYDDIVSMPEMEEVVREMMEEQHKNMLRDLKDGKYNHKFEDVAAEGAKEAPKAAAAPAAAKPLVDPARTLPDVILDYFRAQG